MKVSVATGLYPPEIGGPATYATMLEKELPKQDIEVVIVPFGWVRHYPKIIRHFVYAWKLGRESRQADLIYALDPISVGLPAALVARMINKPFLIRLTGDYAWEQGRYRLGLKMTFEEYLENRDKASFIVKGLARVQTFVLRRAEQIVVPSRYMKDVVMKWGINSGKVKVIKSALFPLPVTESRDKLRKELSFSNPTVVSAGRIVPWKGFAGLIEVVAKLRDKYPDISLVIVGDGKDRVRLQNQVADLKMTPQVRFMGSLTKEALGATIKAADVFVLNTAYEGLSHQLIEVMDIGTPVVTTTAGGNTELITDGVNGYLVEFGKEEELYEAIDRVLSHPESRDRIVQTARAHSKSFAKEKSMGEIVSLFREIV